MIFRNYLVSRRYTEHWLREAHFPMNKDQLDLIKKSLDDINKRRDLTLAFESVRRYREFQQSFRIDQRLQDSLRTLSGPNIQWPDFRANFNAISASVDRIRERNVLLSSQLAQVSSQLAQAVAASAFNREEFRNLITNMSASFRRDDFRKLLNERLRQFDLSVESLRNTYIGDVAARAREVFETGDAKKLADLETFIAERVTDDRQSGETSLALINLILVVLTFIIAVKSMWLQQESVDIARQQQIEARSSSQVQNEAYEKLVQLIDELRHQIAEGDFRRKYVADRTTSLKVRPYFSSNTIGIILKGMSVRVIPPTEESQKFHKWLRVEALDPNTGLPQYGWVNKKYLRRVDS